jgi:hypothetical protein
LQAEAHDHARFVVNFTIDGEARLRWHDRCAIEAGILLNERVAEDVPTMFTRACRLGAEGIVSKKVDGTYRSGPCVLDQGPQSRQHHSAVGRSEIWNK